MTARKPHPPAAAGGNGRVVDIRAHARYQPDVKRSVARRVRAAREALGKDHAGFASYLETVLGLKVTPETASRWEQEAMPPAHVLEICNRILGGTATPGDEVRPYAGRGLISRDRWNEIIDGSAGHLWLYGMAEFGYATDDEVPEILADAAGNGCDVRVLLLDPDCPAAAAVDTDEGSPPGTLPARIRASLARFEAMRRDCPAIGVRIYATHPTVSIVRGDGEMLVTPYLRYFLGSNSPTFALTDESAPGMFSRWEKHFESMWSNSRGQG